ncbi:O-antigen ligase family protein [Aequorivita sediminis]|uniref:O-antigen ligase family protein n=1 Tax=Aequorivita sediminis TaxID=3073653 RepID=UPI0028AC51AD|nr:O-antigen ligase family protein [Aequorivita sp. F6058]
MLYLYYIQVENKLFFDAFGRALKIHTTSFAYLTVIAFSFSFSKLFKESFKTKYHLLYLGQSLYLIVLLFLISTRIAFLALVLLIVVIVINQFRKRKYKKAIFYASIISILLVILTLNGYLSERVENLYTANIENKSDLENRFVIWNCALEVFKNNDIKVLGLGLVNSNALLQECYYQKSFFGKDLGYHAHNQYLQTLIAGGLIGLLVLIFLIVYVFTYAIRHKNLPLLSFVLIFSIFFITESVFEQQIGVTTFSLFLGLFFCHKNAENSKL